MVSTSVIFVEVSVPLTVRVPVPVKTDGPPFVLLLMPASLLKIRLLIVWLFPVSTLLVLPAPRLIWACPFIVMLAVLGSWFDWLKLRLVALNASESVAALLPPDSTTLPGIAGPAELFRLSTAPLT